MKQVRLMTYFSQWIVDRPGPALTGLHACNVVVAKSPDATAADATAASEIAWPVGHRYEDSRLLPGLSARTPLQCHKPM
jgi:hypothetical protein